MARMFLHEQPKKATTPLNEGLVVGATGIPSFQNVDSIGLAPDVWEH